MMTETKPAKRGRPSVFYKGQYEMLKSLWNEVRTRRGILNKYWESKAFAVIKTMSDEGIQGLDYLANKEEGTLNSGLLRELGRYSESDIRLFAIEICKAQKNPESKKTVRMWGFILRQMRLNPERFEREMQQAISETVSENQEDEKTTVSVSYHF